MNQQAVFLFLKKNAGEGLTPLIHVYKVADLIPDTDPPVFTSPITSTNIDYNSADISFTTDEWTSGVLEYGLSADTLDQSITLEGGVNHALTLSDLDPDTTYYMRVTVEDKSDNETIEIASFITEPPDLIAPIISDIDISDIDYKSAHIAWSTDELAEGTLEYGLSADNLNLSIDFAFATDHELTLLGPDGLGLEADTTYYVRVVAIDESKNQTISNVTSFTTQPPDLIAPIITSGPDTDVGVTQVTIHWTTNEDAFVQVEYGLDTGYGSITTLTLISGTIHDVVLLGLTADTTYHYRVISIDESGNELYAIAVPPYAKLVP